MIATAFLCALWVPALFAEEIAVVVHPENRNVSINEDVSFSCEIENADILIWLINDIAIEEQEHGCVKDFQTTRKSGKVLVGNLRLPITGCSKEFNNTYVKCKGVSVSALPFVVLSNSAKLMLQGTVGSPEAMNATTPLGAKFLNIYWDAPYTLDGIRIEYNVTFSSNSSSLGNGSIITTDTYYNLPTPVADHDYYVMACATAKTEAGVGPEACAPEQMVPAGGKVRSEVTAESITTEDELISTSSCSSGSATRNLLLMILSLSIPRFFLQ